MLVSFAGSFHLLGLPHNFGQTQHFDTLVVIVSGVLTAALECGVAGRLDVTTGERRSGRRGSTGLRGVEPRRMYRQCDRGSEGRRRLL